MRNYNEFRIQGYCFVVIFLILCCVEACSAQTSTSKFARTINSLGYSINENLTYDEVQYVYTKSERVIVEYTVSVTHDKSSSIMKHIAAHDVVGVQTAVDEANRTITLNTPKLKPIIVDGVEAKIRTTAIVYLPNKL